MNFEYFFTEQPMDSIDIFDIGNTYLDVYNDDAQEWLLEIYTELGWTTIKQLGPIDSTTNSFDSYFSYTFNRFEYNDKKINKIIESFLNNPKYRITQATEISSEEFLKKFNKIVDIL